MVDLPPDKSTNQRRRQSDQVRLESWKAIANHLKRSVRTVRRWEATEGLPVHRHRHAKGYTVFAFLSELDAWRSGHQYTFQSSSDEGPTGIPPKIKLGIYAVVVFAALVVGVVGGRFMLSSKPAPQSVVSILSSPVVGAIHSPQIVAQALVRPVFSMWAAGQVQGAYRESQSVRQKLPDLPREVQGAVIDHLIEFSLILGRIDDAKTLLVDLDESGTKRDSEARIAFAAGDVNRVGDVLKASRVEQSTTAQAEVFIAMAAMQAGNMAEAKSRFTHATSELVVEDRGYFFVALDMLASLLKAEGKLAEAIDVLEQTMPQRAAAAQNRSGLFWLMCQRQLAKAYREVGRDNDADRVENELREFTQTFPWRKALPLLD